MEMPRTRAYFYIKKIKNRLNSIKQRCAPLHGALTPYLKRIAKPIKQIIYPPLCWHCEEILQDHYHLLCSACFDLFSLLSPKHRCRRCFKELQAYKNPKEHPCIAGNVRIASAFEHQGPVVTLLRRLTYFRQYTFAKALAPFLAMQWAQLQWPVPDLIVPIPQTFGRTLIRGINPVDLLAEELGALLGSPVSRLLKRQDVLIPQRALPLPQRNALRPETFQWSTIPCDAHQTILLVDDTIVTGATLAMAASRLHESAPAGIYALTLTLSPV